MLIVRQEQPGDIQAMQALTEQAFGRVAEARLIAALREQGQILLSCVAEQVHQIVGHCLFSPVSLTPGVSACALVGLGPMAVLPTRQRQGIGTQLVRYGVEYFRQAPYNGVVVLGHAAYYPRFGFVPASRYGLRCVYDVPDDVFMALPLYAGALDACAGTVQYPPAFNTV